MALKVTGWRTVGEPPQLDKYVLIAAPHTSNWDFLVMLPVVLKYKLDVHWVGKHTLFPFPIAWFVRWLGGIPINRTAVGNTVEQAADAFRRSEKLVLLIAPEGTRGKVDRWKAGFYHIATRVELPIQLAFLDTKSKTVGFGPLVQTTGDYDVDLATIRDFYSDKQGIRPEFG
ncbi:lysophospholipid acyltransferase family protein [Litorivivens sp.]|uniref:lysophospholipid acyltransferase family protein n=1 Tax=Litorivivens sp. TaxID=2020868 RepID=UPI003567DBA8